jgi:hypothetical protein
MKISRKNLNRLIESLLNEDKLPPKYTYTKDDKAILGVRSDRQYDELGDYELQGATRLDPTEGEISNAEKNLMIKAMTDYIKEPPLIGAALVDLGVGGISGLNALGQLLAGSQVGIGMAGISGYFLGGFIDEIFRKDKGDFTNNVIRRAAGVAGLGDDLDRYSQPSVEDIVATGFEGLKPSDVDPEFQRKLAIMHILSSSIKNDSDKPAIIKSYETFVDQGIIDGNAFDRYANEVSEELAGHIKQAASSK